MGIPRHTRIVLIPADERSTREYGISRPMVVFLMVLSALACAALVLLMVALAWELEERRTIGRLELELNDANLRASHSAELARELEEMRRFQEQLLTMLGVEESSPASAESLATWTREAPTSSAEAMQRSAALTMQPGPERWPTGGYVTREFIVGNRSRGVEPHPGLDIAAAKDTPILAAGTGVVVRAGEDAALGNYVEIEHGLGYLTVYGHCSRLAVGPGTRVEAGQIVGYMGASGQATATHLHFEIWHQGEAVDPRTVLEGDPPRN